MNLRLRRAQRNATLLSLALFHGFLLNYKTHLLLCFIVSFSSIRLEGRHVHLHSFVKQDLASFIMYIFSLSLLLLSAATAIPHFSHNHSSQPKRGLTPDNTCGGTNGYSCNPSDPYGGSCCSAAGWCGNYFFSASIVMKALLNMHRKLG